MNNSDEIAKHIGDLVKIAQLVLDCSDNGVPTHLLISSLASAIDMLIEKDDLDHKETWEILYIKSQLINELS